MRSWKYLRRTLHENTGSIYVDFLVGFFVLMLSLAFALTVLPIFAQKTKLDYAADRLLRKAEVTGSIDQDALAQELRDETGLNFTISWTGSDTMAGTRKVQLDHVICVELRMSQTLGLNGIGSSPVTLRSKLVGRSEVYYK